MKRETKRILAKEIIIIFCCVVITGLLLCVFLIRNIYFDNKIEGIERKLNSNNSKIDSLNRRINLYMDSLTKEEQKEEWGEPVYSSTGNTNVTPQEQSFLDELNGVQTKQKYTSQEQKELDEINRREQKKNSSSKKPPFNPSKPHNIVPKNDLPSGLVLVDDKNIPDDRIIAPLIDLRDKTDSVKKVFISEKSSVFNKKYSPYELKDLLVSTFIIIILFAYPVRFLIILLIWAIRTLREPSN